MLSVWEKLKTQGVPSEKSSKFRRQVVKALGAGVFFFLRKLPKISQFVLEFNTIIVSTRYSRCSMHLSFRVLEERRTPEK
jgi:hypothetical protein